MSRYILSSLAPPTLFVFLFCLAPIAVISTAAEPSPQEPSGTTVLSESLKETVIYCRGEATEDCSSAAGSRKAPTIALVNIEEAIGASKQGQQARKNLEEQFGPKRDELMKQAQEINKLRNEFRDKERTLTAESRREQLRTIDEKQEALNASDREASAAFRQAEQDAINEIGKAILRVISAHAEKNNYDFVLDSSSPNFSRTYLPDPTAAKDITKAIMDEHKKLK